MRHNIAAELLLAIANHQSKKEKTNLYQKDVFFERKPNKVVRHL